MLEDYQLYSGFIAFAAILSVISTIRSERMNIIAIKKIADTSTAVKRVAAEQNSTVNIKEISSKNLVPGDLVLLSNENENGMICPCDLLLLSGTAFVDESSLTGEIDPTQKSFFVYIFHRTLF